MAIVTVSRINKPTLGKCSEQGPVHIRCSIKNSYKLLFYSFEFHHISGRYYYHHFAEEETKVREVKERLKDHVDKR